MSTITITMDDFSLSVHFHTSTPPTADQRRQLTFRLAQEAINEVTSTASTPTAREETTGSSEQPSDTKPTSSLTWRVTSKGLLRKNIALLTPEELWLAEVPAWAEVTQELVEALYSALPKKTGPA